MGKVDLTAALSNQVLTFSKIVQSSNLGFLTGPFFGWCRLLEVEPRVASVEPSTETLLLSFCAVCLPVNFSESLSFYQHRKAGGTFLRPLATLWVPNWDLASLSAAALNDRNVRKSERA